MLFIFTQCSGVDRSGTSRCTVSSGAPATAAAAADDPATIIVHGDLPAGHSAGSPRCHAGSIS